MADMHFAHPVADIGQEAGNMGISSNVRFGRISCLGRRHHPFKRVCDFPRTPEAPWPLYAGCVLPVAVPTDPGGQTEHRSTVRRSRPVTVSAARDDRGLLLLPIRRSLFPNHHT